MKKFIRENVRENIIDGNLKSSRRNEKWVTDITYISYVGRHAYLSTILDLHTRDIIASVISNRFIDSKDILI